MYLKVSSKPSVALKAKGFQVSGENLVNANGDYFHLPRSVKRALSAESAGKKVKPFQFLLKAEPFKAKKVSSYVKPNEWWAHSTQLQHTVKLKESKPKFIVTSDAVSFFYNGKDYSTSKANPMFSKIVEHLKNNKMDDAVKLVDIANAVDASSNGLIKNDNGILKHGDKELNETVTDWIIRNMGKGTNAIQPVINFLKLLKRNPSEVSVDSLWRFIRKNGLIITSSGYFIGYRYLSDTFYDRHTGKHFNGLGQTLSMKREDVDPDINNPCSHGYHIGTFNFVKGNSTIVECLVSPEMVVSCPKSEEDKIRVCEYTVWKILRNKNIDVSEMSKQEDFFSLNS